MAKNENKVSYDAIANELSRAARMFEVFRNAEEAARVLSNFSKEEKALKADIKKLQGELKSLDEQCDLAYSHKENAESKTKEIVEESKVVLKMANDDAKRIKAEAKAEADKKAKASNDKLERINKNISEAELALQKTLNAQKEANHTLSKIERQIKEARDNFLTAIGE